MVVVQFDNFPYISFGDGLMVATYVLLILFVLFLFWHAVNSPSVHYVTSERPKIPMTRLCNPFTFEVNLNHSSLEGVQCTYSSLKNCYILLLWGVPISSLFKFLNLPWRRMKHILDSPSESPFLSKCSSYMDPFFLNAEERQTTVFRPTAGYHENEISCKNDSRRLKYPFVAVMVLQNNSDVRDNIMIAMATVLHLPDSWLETKPYIIGQFVKSESGRVAIIRKTYSSSSETVNQNGETVNLCTVCYSNEVSLVILPCRHACTCNSCLESCENCPVCRERVVSYFELSVSER